MFAKCYWVYKKKENRNWRLLEECSCLDSNRATCNLLGVLVDKKLCNVQYYDKIVRTPNYNGTVTITVYYHYTIDNVITKWKIEYLVIENEILTLNEEGY